MPFTGSYNPYPSTTMNKVSFFLLLVACLIGGCQKQQVKPAGSAQVTFKVSSATSLVATEISYTNQSGGTTTEKNVPLPFSVTFVRPAGAGTSILQAFITSQTGQPVISHQLSAQILIDGKVTEEKQTQGEEPMLQVGYVHLK